MTEDKLSEAIAGKYVLHGYAPGVITFPQIGEVDLRTAGLDVAEKINKIRPNILVLKGKAEKPEPVKL